MNSINKHGFLLITALLLTGLLSSCLKENFDDCPRPFRLFIKAIDAEQNDITASGEVHRVILFVFNEKQQIVDAVELNASQVKSREPVNILLNYPGHESLTFIAWGNVDENVEFPKTTSVKALSDLYVRLRSASAGGRTRGALAQSPCDLFHGTLNVPVEYGGLESAGDQTIVISRKTLQVTISAYSLKMWNENKEGTYTFELRESNDSYDKEGNLSGDMVGYQPASTMDADGNLFTPIFHAFPTNEKKSYTLYILFNDEVIYTADKGSDGVSFVSGVGRLLNIIIDFRAGINIKSVVTPWNVVYQYVEYQ